MSSAQMLRVEGEGSSGSSSEQKAEKSTVCFSPVIESMSLRVVHSGLTSGPL